MLTFLMRGSWNASRSRHSRRRGRLTSQHRATPDPSLSLHRETHALTNDISVTSQDTVLAFLYRSCHKDLKKEKANLGTQPAISNWFSSF